MIDKMQENSFAENARASDMNLLELLIIITTHKVLIICVTLVALLIGAAIAFLLPNVYKASTTVLPPQQAQSGAAAILSQLGGVAGVAAGAAGIKSPNDIYIGILKSRTISDKLIKQFDLQRVYDVETLEAARKKLEGNTAVTSTKEGLINIDVLDKDPTRVFKIANSYVTELVSLTKSIAITEAGQRRMFFEKQLEETKDKLASAEVKLKGSMEASGVVSVDADSKAIVETAARLRAQISAKEIELNAMQSFVTSDNPGFKLAQAQLKSLKTEEFRLANGRGKQSDSGLQESSGLKNIRTLRDLKYFQMLYDVLAKQYEVARLDEAKDTSLIQVLDVAQQPERKAKPARALIALMAAIFGFLAAVAWAFFRDSKRRTLSTAHGAEQYARLRTSFKFR